MTSRLPARTAGWALLARLTAGCAPGVLLLAGCGRGEIEFSQINEAPAEQVGATDVARFLSELKR